MIHPAAIFLPLVLSTFQPALAQTSNATCLPSFDWSFNSLRQSPCVMASYLRAACKGNHQINALPPGYSYNGPGQPEFSEPCWCSSVTYSLYEACQLCQGVNENTHSWGQWSVNCTASDINNGTFPKNIPVGTVIPAWAFGKVYNPTETFSVVEAQNFLATNSSEIAHSASPSSGASGSSGLGFPRPTNDSPGNTNGSGGGSNAGAIAGGVVGGVVGLALIAGLIWFLLRRRRRDAPAQVNTPMAPQSKPLMSSEPEIYQPTFTQPPMNQYNGTKFYNPSDPSTFPTHSSVSNPTPAPTYHSRVDEIRPNRLGTPGTHPNLPEV